jgi:hypothetical protein
VTARRFPPPWTVQNNEDAYWVEDKDGKRFGFCYYRNNNSMQNAAMLQEDEARRIATNIARLPELLK